MQVLVAKGDCAYLNCAILKTLSKIKMYCHIEIFSIISSKNCNVLKTLCKNKIHVHIEFFRHIK